ncbi:hypothetical protein AYI70_g11078 [Smittium culicis]|uniref:Uncharacterized protein n=1 Tax=Smittium culicis TaxID=133412 RepID=A0A1R1X3I4_9FUNG|nr:hypothetical protein AYI70_g11078 [Smittium culicis]
MERAVIISRNTRDRNIHRFQRRSLENCFGLRFLLWNLRPTTEKNSHQFKGATDGELCSEDQEYGDQIDVSLLIKLKHTPLNQDAPRYNLLRTDFFTLSENLSSPQSNMNPFTYEPRA